MSEEERDPKQGDTWVYEDGSKVVIIGVHEHSVIYKYTGITTDSILNFRQHHKLATPAPAPTEAP